MFAHDFVLSEHEICFYTPWWTTQDYRFFLWFMGLLSIVAWTAATARPKPRLVAVADETHAGYRQVPGIRWRIQSIRALRWRLAGFWVLRFPFITVVVAQNGVGVHAAGSVVQRRHIFIVRSGMWVESLAQWVLFLRDSMEQSALPSCPTRSEPAPGDSAYIRRMLAHTRRKYVVAMASGALVLFIPSTVLPWALSRHWPILSQRMPAMIFSGCALLILAVVVRLRTRHRLRVK